jgi:hypothetical protein
MRSRLQDLIATADRQLASRSYDAAIDTYRTAMGEPGAVEAGIQEHLEAACRTRDAALGVARPVEPPPEMPAPPPAPLPEPPVVEMTEPDVESRPTPLPPAVVDDRPIEPPSFHLIEDDPPIFERAQPHSYEGPEPLSILDPKPPAEEVDALWMARIAVAALIVIAVCVVVFLAK